MISIVPVEGVPEIKEGDDLAALIAERAELQGGDVLVVAQKVVSKAEGRVVRLAEVEPSDEARRLAAGEDPRRLEVILREAKRIVRTRPPLVVEPAELLCERAAERARAADDRDLHTGTPRTASASRRRASASLIRVRVTIVRIPASSSASASSITSASIKPW